MNCILYIRNGNRLCIIGQLSKTTVLQLHHSHDLWKLGCLTMIDISLARRFMVSIVGDIYVYVNACAYAHVLSCLCMIGAKREREREEEREIESKRNMKGKKKTLCILFWDGSLLPPNRDTNHQCLLRSATKHQHKGKRAFTETMKKSRNV